MKTYVVPVITVIVVLTIVLGAILIPLRSPASQEVEAKALLRWGYYVTYADNSKTSLESNLDQLDVVSPYYYHLTPNGSLKEFDEPETTATIRANSNAKILPIVQNEARWDDFTKMMKTPEQRQAAVELLVDLVETKHYDGIHIDFEAINAADSDLLTDFMKRLSEAFRPRGLITSQAVIPRLSDRSTVWGGAYDFAKLAQHNDYIVIMAYDHTPVGSTTPGAVAPLTWVREAISYTSSQIPESQLILGVPFYGYDWNTADGPPATAVTYDRAMELSRRPGATSGYSADESSPWVRYTDDDGDPHEVWFENSVSFEEKLQAAMDYDLAGFAAWRLGHEDPDNWRVVANLETPASPLSPRSDTATSRYFSETGHTLTDQFLRYWESNGGLSRFGYPRTEPFVEYDPFVGQSYLVQYFERARFELHPEFAGTEYEVLLGHTGRWALQEQRGIDPWESAGPPQPGKRYFEETGHSMSPLFEAHWETRGGLNHFGYPISDEFTETNLEDGADYTVQYFERARFEYHPEFAGTEFEVLLGLLGNEMLRERGWIR
ncbi:MAG: peptidoglycan hydrolase [Chloroflexia bacterium]|nr:peptidoglycan hydrolase [Chloroflexia bacterium]